MSNTAKREFPKHGIMTAAEVDKLSIEELVELRNLMCPDKEPITSFPSKSKARAAVWVLGKPIVETPAEPVAGDESNTNNENGDTDMANKAKTEKKAKKADGEKKAKKGGGTRVPAIDPATPLSVLVDKNPKREGSASFKRFEGYKRAKTVQQALDHGVTLADIRWDVDHKYIKLG